jgi:hypothetical protein
MNKKERKLACATALQSAAADMIVCDDFSALEQVGCICCFACCFTCFAALVS